MFSRRGAHPVIVGRWLAAAENKGYKITKRREINPRPTERYYEKDIFCVLPLGFELPRGAFDW